MGSNTIVEEPTNDFDLMAEKKPTFSTVKSQTKKAYSLIESSLTLSNIKIIQSFDRLKIWVDLNEHGKDIGFKLGKNMKLSDIPYLPPPEQYIRMNKDICNDTLSDIPVNNTDEYDDEVVDIKDRKNKYKNCTINYSVYKRTIGITNIYINKDILVIDITGKLMAAYGDLGLININNIKECLKKLIDLELFTFNIDKFLKYAGCYLADVTMDLFLGKEKRCKRMINAISSFLPIISKDFNNKKYKRHGLMIRRKSEDTGYSFIAYMKKSDLNKSILRETKSVRYTEIIGEAGEYIAKSTLRLETHIYKMKDLRKFLNIPAAHKGFVPLMAVLRSKQPVILNVLKEMEIDEQKLYNRLSWIQVKDNFLKDEKCLSLDEFKDIVFTEWIAKQIIDNDYNTDITRAHILTEYSIDIDDKLADKIMPALKRGLLNFICYRKPKSISLVILLLTLIYDKYFDSAVTETNR